MGVFGPVVNPGGPAGGADEVFEVPICIDETTTAFVQEGLPPEEGRLRMLARLRPKGDEDPGSRCPRSCRRRREMPQVTAICCSGRGGGAGGG